MKATIEIPDNTDCLQIKFTLNDGTVRYHTINAATLNEITEVEKNKKAGGRLND